MIHRKAMSWVLLAFLVSTFGCATFEDGRSFNILSTQGELRHGPSTSDLCTRGRGSAFRNLCYAFVSVPRT